MDHIATQLVKDGMAASIDQAKTMIEKYLECTVPNGVDRGMVKLRMAVRDFQLAVAR